MEQYSWFIVLLAESQGFASSLAHAGLVAQLRGTADPFVDLPRVGFLALLPIAPDSIVVPACPRTAKHCIAGLMRACACTLTRPKTRWRYPVSVY